MAGSTKRKTQVVCISLPPDMVELLDAARAKNRTSRSQVVRELLNEWFDELEGAAKLPFDDADR